MNGSKSSELYDISLLLKSTNFMDVENEVQIYKGSVTGYGSYGAF